MMESYVIGLDYGSDSVRAVLINAENGNEIASEVHWYARWKNGAYSKNCSKNHDQASAGRAETNMQTFDAGKTSGKCSEAN